MTVVERNRTHYARAYGDSKIVRLDEAAIDLELPASYARDLLADLRRAIAEGGGDSAQISLDVPIRLHLTLVQVEQLAAKLAEDGR
jgi:hypothetical protein